MNILSILNPNAKTETNFFEDRFIYLSNLLLSFFILNIGPIERKEIVGFIILAVYVLNHATFRSKKNTTTWINIISYSSICLVILSTIFSSNIFSIFNISSIKIILMSGIVFSSSYFSISDKLKNKYLEYIGLVIPLICNLLFILTDYSEIDIWDNSRHARNTFIIYDKLIGSEGNKALFSIFYFDFYPNLVYLVNQPFIFLFGKSLASIQLCNIFFWLPLGYIFLRKIQNECCKISGLPISISGLIIFSNQISLFYQRSCLLDFPALSMAIVLIYFYLRSEGFTIKRYAIFFGIITSLGMLIKATFLIIGAGCILYQMIYMIATAIRFKKIEINLIHKKFENIFLAALFIFIIAGIYYGVNYNHFNFQLKDVTIESGKREGDPYPYSLDSVLYYVKAFYDYYGSIANQIIIIIFCIVFLVFFKKRKQLNISLLTPLILFYISATLTWNKDYRTFMPALALLIPVFSSIELIKNKIIKATIYSICYLCFFLTTVNSFTGNALNYNFIKIHNNYDQIPRTPDYINNLDAYYISSLMHKHLFDEEIKEKLNVNLSKTNYTDELYANKYKKAFDDFKKADIRNFSKILYVKDEIYNDYYLIGITKLNDSLLKVKILCAATIIGGDIELKISGKDSIDKNHTIEQTVRLSHQSETEIQIPSTSNSNKIILKIYHSWPSAQLYDTYYKLMKRKNYDNNNMIILNENIKENKLDLSIIPIINPPINISPQ
jgi:hypothetical protein